ncbi:Major Facilitator Superfamily (MFS) [Phytophthora cinnamomi]|uniref:Major Facilitator Superfamily (MFS) n=1 Tax=Phytophthora cinnamomi TaxID=4785 RepID=UPI003559BBE6|nr:Major Facilitator Superfamily (MFS) [Phytophthora cinnamomi]
MAAAGELLVHVRQRLDALTYDDHSQYLLSSLQASPFVQSLSLPPPTTSTSRRRRTLLGSGLRYAGLTGFYVRLVLLLGTGWLLAMVGIFTFLYALPAAQEDIVVTSTAQVILLLGVYFLGGAAGCLAFGVCADHFGRRPVLLGSLSFWLVVNALTAGAWNYASFVTLRFLAGMGIGGQLALLSTLALEYTPTRTRGRITVLTVSMAGLGVLAGVGYGQVACAAMGEGGLGWRVAYGVLSAVALLFAAVLYLALEESPKYLASVGRTEEALYVLEKIETAHGINRQARVTVPTSLYEPPSQRPQVSYERYLESSSDSDSDLGLDLREGHRSGQGDEIQREMRARSASRVNRYSYAGPGAARARSQSQRASARRLHSRHQHQFEVCTPSSEGLGTPSDTLAPTADISFLRALAHRVVALFSGSLARRTAVIWFFWFAEFTCLSAAIVTTLMMAGTFVKVNALGEGFGVGDQLFWSAMTCPGLLLAAMMVETVGRRGTLAVFVLCAGAVMVVSAWLLEEDGEWLSLLLSLGALVLATGGTIGSLIPFTGEQFPLLTRALGISCSAAWGHLGMFAGVYLVLRRVMGDEAWTWHDERLMLAGCGGVAIILIPLILFMGPETRGRDIDASWFEDNKALHALAGGVLSAAPGGRPEQPASRFRGVSKARRGNKKLGKGSESSDGDDRELPESPFGSDSLNGLTLAAPVIYSPTSATHATGHSPCDYESSSCSSSSSSGFWQTHSVRHLGRKMKQAITQTSEEKHAVYLPSGAKLQARSTSGAKRTRDRSVDIDDRCDTVMDDLDQLDSIVTEHEYRQHRLSIDDASKDSQPRRQSMLELLEPVLLEWRRSISSSLSGSVRDLSSSSKASKASKAEHSASISKDTESATAVSDVRSSATGRFTIDLDMFDTFTYISTPVLGGDNYSEHEHREPSNLSSVSSGDAKQASS